MSRTVFIVCGAGLVSGKEIVSLALARELRRRGWRVEVLTSRWGSPRFRALLDAEEIPFHQLWLGFLSISLRWSQLSMTLDQVRRLPSLLWRYGGLLASSKPAVVIHTNWHHALLLLSFMKPGRDIYWCHEILPVSGRYRTVFRLIADRVAGFVCVSGAVSASLRALRVSEDVITVVHNGADGPSGREVVRPARSLRLGIVGQVEAWKGHQDAIAAISLLAARGRYVTLTIFGQGSAAFLARLQEQAELSGIAEHIDLRGFVEDHDLIYRDMDVCLIPSRFEEPFGMTAVEAALRSCPSICTSTGGLPEVVTSNVTGVIVPPERPDQLASAIERFLDDPSLAKKMGEAAKARALSLFSTTVFGDAFETALKRLSPGHSPPVAET